MENKRVTIVNTGGWGLLSAERGDYDSIAQFLEKVFSRDTTVTINTTKSVEWAESRLDQTDVLIFLTSGLLVEAKRIKKANQHLKVIVLTGRHFTDDEVDEVLIVKKPMSINTIKRLIKS